MSADTATAPPQLRPLALGEIVDVSIQLMRRNWRTLCVLVLIVAVPVAVVNFLVTTSTTTYDATLDIRSADDGSAYDAGQFVNVVLGIAVYLIASVGCVQAVGAAYMGRAPDWRSSLRFAARRALPALGLSILYVVGIFLGFFALIVGAIFLAIRWSVAMPALVLERRGPISALGRSWSLVGGFWWKCFGTLLIAYLLLIVLSIAFGAVLGGVLAALSSVDSFLGLLLQQVVNVAIQVVTLPLFAAVTVVLYVDLRVRKEGFDLALAADRIAHPDRAVTFGTTAGPEPARHPPPRSAPSRPGPPAIPRRSSGFARSTRSTGAPSRSLPRSTAPRARRCARGCGSSPARRAGARRRPPTRAAAHAPS